MCVYVCVCVCMCVCMHACMCVCNCMCVCVCACARMCVSVNMCAYAVVHIFKFATHIKLTLFHIYLLCSCNVSIARDNVLCVQLWHLRLSMRKVTHITWSATSANKIQTIWKKHRQVQYYFKFLFWHYVYINILDYTFRLVPHFWGMVCNTVG